MKWNVGVAALILAASASASAATLSVSPANPTTADTLVLAVQGANPCASVVPNGLAMTDGRVIRVRYNDGANIQCFQATDQPPRVTLGRFPAGTYTVQLVPETPGAPVDAPITVTVVNSAGGPNDPPGDNYTGYYLTDKDGEGVFVQQFGDMAFVSFLYYGANGKATWAVMPDATWTLGSGGGFSFVGAVYQAEIANSGSGSGTGVLRSVYILGQGSFIPAGGLFDRARLQVELGAPSVERLLTRFRF